MTFLGWFLRLWFWVSAWLNRAFGVEGFTQVIISIIALFVAVIALVVSIKAADSDLYWDWDILLRVISCAFFGLVIILVATFATARVYRITLVPKIHNISYASAEKVCEDAGLRLPYNPEQKDEYISFQFPRAGSIASKNSEVYTWDTRERFIKYTIEVDSLFPENDAENKITPTKDPNSASDMIAIKVLSEDGEVEDCLYGWVIRNKDGKDLLSDFWYYKENAHYDSVKAYNYSCSTMFKSIENRATPNSHVKYSSLRGYQHSFPYEGFKEEVNSGNVERWDYVGFNHHKYTKIDKKGKLLFEEEKKLNKDGEGTCEWHDHETKENYNGKYSNGAYNGKGTYTYADGSVYKGNFVDGKRSGKGVLTKGKNFYKGEWLNDQKNGHGKEKDVDDDGVIRKFKGNYLNDKYVGQGEWSCKTASGNVETYSGEFKDSMRNGYGEYHFANGYIYKGEWKDDLQDGQGKLYDKDGNIIQDGTYEADKYVGE